SVATARDLSPRRIPKQKDVRHHSLRGGRRFGDFGISRDRPFVEWFLITKRSPDEPTGRREAPPDDRLRDIRGSLLNLQAPHVAPLIRATLLPAYAGSPLSDKICAAPPMARRKASSKVTPRSCHRCGRPCHAICHSVAHPSSR